MFMSVFLVVGCSQPNHSNTDKISEETNQNKATTINGIDENSHDEDINYEEYEKLLNQLKQESKELAIKNLIMEYEEKHEYFFYDVAKYLVMAFEGVTENDREDALIAKDNFLYDFEPEVREIYDAFVRDLIEIEIEYNE